MQLHDAIQLLLTFVIAIWGIIQYFYTKRVEEQLHRLLVGLDQSIQLMHRARDAAIGMHRTQVLMISRKPKLMEFDDLQANAFAEYSAYWAELRGLAFAINDQKLLELVNNPMNWIKVEDGSRTISTDEMTLRGRFQPIHTRIAQLIEERTVKYGR